MVALTSDAQQVVQPIRLWFLCGAGAQITDDVNVIRNLVKSQNVTAIRGKIANGNETEKLLSAIWLTEYIGNETLSLYKAELLAIKKIRRSKTMYEVCMGCTFVKKGTIRKLFSKQGKDVRELVAYFLKVQEGF